MDDTKQQVVDRLKQANNILVTVKSNPSIDLLSACIGLALLLDKLDKHAAAVFSGDVPSAIEFLKPEETLEPTTNSLRDFIISLDKSKADKLRYKVEDKVVRIFITPYRTSLSQDDLQFSQGDFNIDVVVALGVREQAELDAAITAHGRILHDATVVSITNLPDSKLGAINWQDVNASSVSEMVADLTSKLGPNLLDEQVSTALLTGIVAETARFSNDKTTPQAMRLAGELMASGANQQLVANELQANAAAIPHAGDEAGNNAGTLEIAHPDTHPAPEAEAPQQPEEAPVEMPAEPPAEQEAAESETHDRAILPMPGPEATPSTYDTQAEGNTFVAGSDDDATFAPQLPVIDEPAKEPGVTPASMMPPNPFATGIATSDPLLTHDSASSVVPPTPATEPTSTAAPAAPVYPESGAVPAGNPTLEQIEESVESPHLGQEEPQKPEPEPADTDRVGDARLQVEEALKGIPEKPAAFNAQPLGDPLHPAEPQVPVEPAADTETSAPAEPQLPAIKVDPEGNMDTVPNDLVTDTPMDMPLPQVVQPIRPIPTPAPTSDPTSATPPEGPPPLLPPSYMNPAA